jgi:hypothetical protein
VRLEDCDIASPERRKDEAVCRLGAFDETRDVKRRVSGKDRADARTRKREVGEVSRVVGAWRWSRRLGHARLDPRIGVGGLEDRLLLVPGTLTENAVEPKADEQSDEREDDDDGQFDRILFGIATNIMRRA